MIWKPFRTRWQGCWAGPALSACPVANAKRCGTGVADKIEKELQYPGEIKVSVIRETRVIEYAR